MSYPVHNFAITEKDRVSALLAYLFAPISPIILLIMEDKRHRPYIQAHNAQAMVLGGIGLMLGISLILSCLWPLVFMAQVYFGWHAYEGKSLHIPLITDFCRKQVWA